jgi:hypothetical protein
MAGDRPTICYPLPGYGAHGRVPIFPCLLTNLPSKPTQFASLDEATEVSAKSSLKYLTYKIYIYKELGIQPNLVIRSGVPRE